MHTLGSFFVRYGKRKALDMGKSKVKYYVPSLLQPLTPGFWFFHPFKAFYLWVLLKTLRLSWCLFKRYCNSKKGI